MFNRGKERPKVQKKAPAARSKSSPGQRVAKTGFQPYSVVHTYRPHRNKNGELMPPPDRPATTRRRRVAQTESDDEAEDDDDESQSSSEEDNDDEEEDESYHKDSGTAFEHEHRSPTADVTCICPKRPAFKAGDIVTCLGCDSRQHLHCFPVIVKDWQYIDDTCCIACSERSLLDSSPRERRKTNSGKQAPSPIKHDEGRAELELQAIRGKRKANTRQVRKDSMLDPRSDKKARRGVSPQSKRQRLLAQPSPDSPSVQRSKKSLDKSLKISKMQPKVERKDSADSNKSELFVSSGDLVDKEEEDVKEDSDTDGEAKAEVIDGDDKMQMQDIPEKEEEEVTVPINRQNIVCDCTDGSIATPNDSVLCGRCHDLQHRACIVVGDERNHLLKSPRCNNCKRNSMRTAFLENKSNIAEMQQQLYYAGVQLRDLARTALWKHYCGLPAGSANPTVVELTETQPQDGRMAPVHDAPEGWIEGVTMGVGRLLDASGAEVGSEAYDGKNLMGDNLVSILKAWRELALWTLHYGPFNGDKSELGILAEVLGLVEKGTFWDGT